MRQERTFTIYIYIYCSVRSIPRRTEAGSRRGPATAANSLMTAWIWNPSSFTGRHPRLSLRRWDYLFSGADFKHSVATHSVYENVEDFPISDWSPYQLLGMIPCNDEEHAELRFQFCPNWMKNHLCCWSSTSGTRYRVLLP